LAKKKKIVSVSKTKKKHKTNLPEKYLRNGGPGRPKGSKDKFTDLKNAFLTAFDNLGGIEGLTEWAKKNNNNKTQFYHMITKLLPKTVDVNAGDAMHNYVHVMQKIFAKTECGVKKPKSAKNGKK